ncbi:MAG: hypothetical protein IBJ11_07455 [Phycisphaerales bacterium]|nr:hypothetical protein [Phycisphaerales bacterium]
MHVLHLIDPSAAGWPALRALAAAVAGRPGGLAPAVVVIGGSDAAREAEAAGLTVFDRLPARLNRADLANLPALLDHRPRPALVHAWSPLTLELASWCLAGVPTVATLGRARPPEADFPARFNPTILATGEQLRSHWTSELPDAREVRFVALPVGSPPDDPGRRAALRGEWELPPDVVLFVPLADPSHQVDAFRVAYQAGVMTVVGRPAAAVVPSTARDLERAMRLVERHENPWPVIVDDRPLPEILPGCDVGLWTEDPFTILARGEQPGGGDPTHVQTGVEAVAWAAAAGVPVIAEDVPRVRDVLPDEDMALFVPPADRLTLNRLCLAVCERRAEAPARAAAARAHVLAGRSRGAFLAAVGAAYASAVAGNTPNSVRALEPMAAGSGGVPGL